MWSVFDDDGNVPSDVAETPEGVAPVVSLFGVADPALSWEVRAECLQYALEHDERFGIWGGLSERERRKLKRRLG